MNLEAEIKRLYDRERGVMLGYLESLHLSDRELEGAKATLKTLSYNSQSEVMALLADDGMRLALDEAHAARKEIRRSLAILTEKGEDPKAVPFLTQRLTALDRQISDIQEVIRGQAMYARHR